MAPPIPILTSEQFLTPAQLAELEAEHGRIAHGVMKLSHELAWQLYPLDDEEEPMERPKRAFFELVVRPATAAEVRIYKQRSKTAAAASADDELLKQTCVHPTPPVLAAIMDPKRGWALLSSGAAKAILRLSGAAVEEEGKG